MYKYQMILIITFTYFILISANPKRINCRKYVFAPVCRGVAAKRIVPDSNEMIGDDPNAYMSDASVLQTENENQIKSDKESQGRQWYFEDRRRNAGAYLEKRLRRPDTDYDATIYNN